MVLCVCVFVCMLCLCVYACVYMCVYVCVYVCGYSMRCTCFSHLLHKIYLIAIVYTRYTKTHTHSVVYTY